MKRIFLLFLILPFLSTAQESSTIFQPNLNLSLAKEKVKKENKYLLVYCYSITSIISERMAETVFPEQKVSDFLNKNFINIKFKIDKFPTDSPEVRHWQKYSQKIIRQYNLEFYPTFLIFSSQGELVHQIIGGHNPKDFIANVKKAFDPETQYFTLIKRYKGGDRNPNLLKTLVSEAEANGDKKLKSKALSVYLASQDNLLTKENLEFSAKFTTSSKSQGFNIIFKNQRKVDSIMGKGAANKILSAIIIKEEFSPSFAKGIVDFDRLSARARSKHPTIDLSAEIALLKVRYYEEMENGSTLRLQYWN